VKKPVAKDAPPPAPVSPYVKKPKVNSRNITGITKAATEWERVVPPMLTDAQWQEREKTRAFVAPSDAVAKQQQPETRAQRKEAEARVNGLDTTVKRNRQCGVTVEKEETAEEQYLTFVKQFAELADEDREAMQLEFGMLSISPSRQPSRIYGAIQKLSGGESWQTKFDNARLEKQDEGKSTHERLESTAKMLLLFPEKRAKVEAVRIKDAMQVDAPPPPPANEGAPAQPPAPAQPETAEDLELKAIAKRLKKLGL
jgi:hypothetical protein